MYIRWLSGTDVEKALPVSEAVAAVKDAYISATRGDVLQPMRMKLDVEREDGVHLLMPSHQSSLGRSAVKIVSVFPGNVRRNKPVISGIVALFDGETGAPLAVMDASVFTAIRTGAASGAATAALARPDARVLAVIGAGAQAPYQALTVGSVRPIERIHLYNRTPSRAEDMARWLQERRPDIDVSVFARVDQAVAEADVICTATSAQEPVLFGEHLKPGVHVNAVGSFRPNMRELDREVLRRASRLFVEIKDAAWEESGEVADAFEAGILGADDLVEIGAVLAGDAPGRRDADEITVFKSTGIAAQDLHAAARLFDRAEKEDIGTRLAV